MRKYGWIAALFALLWTTGLPAPAASAADEPSRIRAALYIDNGNHARQTVPFVTLKSASGLELFRQTKDGLQRYLQLPESESFRFSFDGFSVLVKETTSHAEAEKTAQALSGEAFASGIVHMKKGKDTVYQVISGNSGDLASAVDMREKIEDKLNLKAAGIVGPYRLQTEPLPSLEKAGEAMGTLSEAGYPAYLGIAWADEAPAYVAVVGNAADEGTRDQWQKNIESELGMSLLPLRETTMVLQKDAVGDSTKTHIRFHRDEIVRIRPAAREGKIPLTEVVEKRGRLYRGEMEVRQHKGKLALINDLPVHEYLYGVVGSEMASGWPLEALKAQAVLARTRAYGSGMKYGIAHVSDTVFEQAYYGYTREKDDIRRAVDETRGMVITYNGRLAQSYYYSNAGGMTASGREVWGTELPYLKPVESDDAEPREKADRWYKVVLLNGDLGYIHSDYVDVLSEKNALGFSYGVLTGDNVNFRNGPGVADHKSLLKLDEGTRFIVLAEVPEDSSYFWSRGPFTDEEITGMIRAFYEDSEQADDIPETIDRLEVTERGPSGRVTEMEVNGEALELSAPDYYRNVFASGGRSLRSTKFEVASLGHVTVLGANGETKTYSGTGGELHAVSAGDAASGTLNQQADFFFAYGADETLQELAKERMYRFTGYGYGHGFGLSQYGAKAMAEQGFDYKEILLHYYTGVKIEEY